MDPVNEERDQAIEERLRHYDTVGRPVPIGARLRQLARHAEVLDGSIARGDPFLTPGATMLATITVLRIAVTAAPDKMVSDLRIESLRNFIVCLPDRLYRTHVVALLDAEDAQRVSSNLPPHRGRMGRWFCEIAGLEGVIRRGLGHDAAVIVDLPQADVDLYAEAALAHDIDLVLGDTIEIVRDLIDLPSAGTDGAYDAIALSGFALCV